MQRILTVLAVSVVSGLVLTGCPEKKAEKEAPATPDIPAADTDQSGADDDKEAEEAEKEEKDEKKPEAEDEGGW